MCTYTYVFRCYSLNFYRVAPQNHCELHRVILRIKEEINANEEKTSSSSAESTPSHTPRSPLIATYSMFGTSNSHEPKNSTDSRNEKGATDHTYENRANNGEVNQLQLNRKADSFRNESEQEMCSMMMGCDISSSTSGVDTSTAGSSSCSDNNVMEGKMRSYNDGGPIQDKFDEHSTSLII